MSTSKKEAAEIAKAEAEARAADAIAKLHAINAEKVAQEARWAGLQADTQALIYADAARQDAEAAASNERNHVYHFLSDVNTGSAVRCIQKLTTWSRIDPGCDIEIVFTSPGGSIIDGFALFDHIQTIRRAGHRVTTSALGMAASMAGVLLQAGDHRVMSRESWLLIHEASFGAGGSFGDVEDTVEWVRRMQDRILDIFAERSTMTKRQLKAKWTRRDWWISADEALAAGFIDEVR